MNERLLEEWKKRDPLLTDINGYKKFVEKHQAKQHLVQQFLENERKILEIHQQIDEQRNQTTEQERQVRNAYWDRINALQKERDNLIDLLREQQELKRKEADQEVSELSKVIAKVDRIIAFLKLKEKDLTIKDEDAKVYHDRHIESLGYFFNDDYLKIKLFIAENDKPKNKYSLIALGNCFFTDQLIDLRSYHGYGVNIHYTGRCDIQLVIKEAPDICDLNTYLEKRRKKILAGLLEQYKQIKAEYINVLAEYNLDLFEPLIAYRCTLCGFFLTRREARHWSRLGDKCPECGDNTLVNLTRVNLL